MPAIVHTHEPPFTQMPSMQFACLPCCQRSSFGRMQRQVIKTSGLSALQSCSRKTNLLAPCRSNCSVRARYSAQYGPASYCAGRREGVTEGDIPFRRLAEPLLHHSIKLCSAQQMCAYAYLPPLTIFSKARLSCSGHDREHASCPRSTPLKPINTEAQYIGQHLSAQAQISLQ